MSYPQSGQPGDPGQYPNQSAYHPGGYDQSYPGPPGYAPQPRPGPPVIRDANPLRATFDFSFNTFATPGLVKVVYALTMVIAFLFWIGTAISGFAASSITGDLTGESTPVFGILALIFGWIPALLWIFVVRIGLELALSVVRTAADIRHIRANAES